MKKIMIICLACVWSSSEMLHAGSDGYEDWINRVNGPPRYRYYDRRPYQNTYDDNQRGVRYDDANIYWGGEYYGNKNPDFVEEYYLDKRILEHENKLRVRERVSEEQNENK